MLRAFAKLGERKPNEVRPATFSRIAQKLKIVFVSTAHIMCGKRICNSAASVRGMQLTQQIVKDKKSCHWIFQSPFLGNKKANCVFDFRITIPNSPGGVACKKLFLQIG
ncbi:hypothetical protein NQ317_017430 [Molorchus minor]|uniref:Uncharacterized protein n=1 Tax=Molorchus minor TaxID=1323400 RepID=A0ABQ9IXI9_9CUCU|nr:hypothetical protein NQ317_017430 [Molorchus minor]